MLYFSIFLLLLIQDLSANTASLKKTCEQICSFPYNSEDGEKLKLLEACVRRELLMVNIPARPWILPDAIATDNVLDVAIIGGGMAGLSAGFALIKEGITNIEIFDENMSGQEGPWTRYARMKMLRSGKTCLGPSMGIPSLTFWAWYEAQYGPDDWSQLKTASTLMWNEYLQWIRKILKLPCENSAALIQITPLEPLLQLKFLKDGEEFIVKARKVVLATGRAGSGGLEVPQFMMHIPKQLYAHTGESIDERLVQGKTIAVIGAGASAFDAAGMALENGAKSVQMLVRRSAVPLVNKFAQFYYPGIVHGFYHLPDELRCGFFAEALKFGIPPPRDALERLKSYSNLRLSYNVDIKSVTLRDNVADIHSSKGDFTVDFIILATGFHVDLSQCRELSCIYSDILLWADKIPQDHLKMPKLGLFPYLGPHFEFQEKICETAAYVKNIYCFNYGAFLSHGLLSGDISLISQGAAEAGAGHCRGFFY